MEKAKKIPGPVRKKILDEGIIGLAKNVLEFGSPMEYLFDVYEEFIDLSGDLDDFTCGKCRGQVLSDFQKMLPILIQFEKAKGNAI
ncbi:MAG: hypothetical protein IPQ08_15465 [Chitinophagaceae bacterium]|nr:hypothetical protein [Chitinophagaceae bacterium]